MYKRQPEEIVNIINEPAMPDPQFDNNLDTFNGGDNQSFLSEDNGLQQDYASDNDFSSDAFGDDADDDNFV